MDAAKRITITYISLQSKQKMITDDKLTCITELDKVRHRLAVVLDGIGYRCRQGKSGSSEYDMYGASLWD